VIEYLVNLINSDFEEWRRDNPTEPNTNFEIKLERMSVSGAMFDIVKLTDMSKDIIAAMTEEEVYKAALEWAKEYDVELAELLGKDELYVRGHIFYFFDALFYEDIKGGYSFAETMEPDEAKRIVSEYIKIYNHSDSKEMWFDRVKEFCETIGYSKNVKSFKKNPGVYKGHVGDVTGAIRVALTNRRNTPDLYEIMQIMGEKKVMERFEKVIKG
jgi:glutamyl-tRNA synthetase